MTISTLNQLQEAVERFAPSAKAAEWDPIGIQIGDGSDLMGGVAVCHEVTEEVLSAARSESVGTLVSYHPLLFKPSTRVGGGGASGRGLAMARSGINLFVIHTNFDAAPGGTADALAEVLGLGDLAAFGTVEASGSKIVTFVPESDVEAVAETMAAAGAGRIGRYERCSFRSAGTGTFQGREGTHPAVGEAESYEQIPEFRLEMVADQGSLSGVVAALIAAHPYEEPAFDVLETTHTGGMIGRVGTASSGSSVGSIARAVSDLLGAEGLRVSGDPGRSVGRVAVVPGSGTSFVGDAATAGADLIVTGDVGHHGVVAARDRGMAVIDPGHAATERPGMKRLYAAVAQIVPEAVDLTHLDPTPWRRS